MVSLREEDSRLVPGTVHYNKSYKKSSRHLHPDGGAAFVEKVQNIRHQPADSFQLFARNRIFLGKSIDVHFWLSYIRSAIIMCLVIGKEYKINIDIQI